MNLHKHTGSISFVFVTLFFFFFFTEILTAETLPQEDLGQILPSPGQNAYPPVSLTGEAQPTASFSEIWAYLQNGDEKSLNVLYPVTDIGYFGAAINYRGHLYGTPVRSKLSGYKGRVHLVVNELSSQALTHFSLDPEYPIRNTLLAEITAASKDFDGVQLDFEMVPAPDAENYYSFLALLKKKIGAKKTLSVAIPARTRNVGDAYDYDRLAKIVDRIIVMAYDEHWSGSVPGSIASLAWCRKVSDYAILHIGNDKLIMGLPFYGRAWTEKNPAKAYRFSGISDLITEKNIPLVNRDESIPFFSYDEIVHVNVFYEDGYSIISRALMYQDLSVRSIAFWKLGQEDQSIWNRLVIVP